jgi:hypothetical protein
MKQHITIEQLKELSEKGKERLRKWWEPKKYDLIVTHSDYLGKDGFQIGFFVSDYGYLNSGYRIDGEYTNGYREKNDCLPLLSIGQMIEFLEEHEFYNFLSIEKTGTNWTVWIEEADLTRDKVGRYQSELCDALWEAVKLVI